MSDRVIYRRPVSDVLTVTGTQDSARGVLSSIYEALVVDVVLDHTHPEYSDVDGYNIGSIKVRIFDYNQTMSDELLPWADPIDNTVQSYPLVGELVVLHKIRGNFFYTKKVPLARRIQENAMLNLNSALQDRSSNTLSKAIQQQSELTADAHKFGQYFKPDSRVRQLKHFEGDTIFQGRMGQSIRFGSSQLDPSSDGLAPNVIIRAGQGKDVEARQVSIDTIFGLIVEDINKDVSSIWLVSDQVVPLEPSTIQAGSFMRSIKNPPQMFDGGQAIINSDRVIINSKNKSIMLFSGQDINLNSYGDVTIDTDTDIIGTANNDIFFRVGRNFDLFADENINELAGKNILLLAGERASILSKKIFIGSVESTSQPMVGGVALAEALEKLVDAISGTSTIAITPSGPGTISPALIAALSRFKADIIRNKNNATFNSRDNFVSLSNQSPTMEKNQFTSGTKKLYEHPEWKLDGQYYRVI